MFTTALRLYGKNDLRLEKFLLPALKEDEILAKVICDSICFSTWKEVNQGENHKKVPNDIAVNPIIVGHEFCGEIVSVGKKWQHKFEVGKKYVVQANLQLPSLACPGYSFPYIGGEATYVIIPKEVLNQNCLLAYNGNTFFEGALIEPLSCVIGAFNANYHLIEGSYNHKMGIKPNGNLIIIGGMGPMGMLAIDYALHGPINPKRIIVTGRTQNKIDYCQKHYPSNTTCDVIYVNVAQFTTPDEQKRYLMQLVDNEGYDDVFIFVPEKDLISVGSGILATDGCLNFFAGPQDSKFEAAINFYDIHYAFTHYVGTSGGNTDDMREGIKLIEQKKINVNKIVTHILGLDTAAYVTANQPSIPGGKKVVYSQKSLPLIELHKLMSEEQNQPFYIELKNILVKTEGIWSKEAEDYILAHAKNIE
ncbi:zinc-binding dehydrogenase [Orbus sturtevantii]|uniref:zinc-binding dehydrogenase n=1 Tax=Orbus sturtevantii TaxID=3074109 RepID=UPI00370D98C6